MKLRFSIQRSRSIYDDDGNDNDYDNDDDNDDNEYDTGISAEKNYFQPCTGNDDNVYDNDNDDDDNGNDDDDDDDQDENVVWSKIGLPPTVHWPTRLSPTPNSINM